MDFEEKLPAIVAAYDEGRLLEAWQILQAVRVDRIPKDRVYAYHDAMGMVAYALGLGETCARHFEAAAADRGSMPRDLFLSLYSNYLMYLHFRDGVTDEAMRAAHVRYDTFFGGVSKFARRRWKHRKLRVGYIAPDFGEHIVLNFVIQLLARHDGRQFEVYLYDLDGKDDEVTQWVSRYADGGSTLAGLRSEAAARRIHEDEIDILFDLAGHTAGGKTLRILAHAPATVQMAGIGYFDTTGLSATDYFLGDLYCDPEGMEAGFVEKLLRLPYTHLNFTPSERFKNFTPHYHRTGSVRFGCFNNFAKITDGTLRLWKEILEAVPGSSLYLKNVLRYPDAVKTMEGRLRGLGFPMERVTVEAAERSYLDAYATVDVALDTYPYPGGGTTCEALTLGIPVVSRYGMRHGQRFGLGLLSNLGLSELCAPSAEAYRDLAIGLASDDDLLRGLHEEIPRRLKASPVMEAERYVRDMEAAYHRIYEAARV